MTVQTDFFDWGNSGLDFKAPQFERMSPALISLWNYLDARWGGTNYGLNDYNRPIRGGKKPSTHSYGAALDYRFEDHPDMPADRYPERSGLDNEILPFLIENSLELGIVGIIDDRRSWRPPAYRDSKGQSHDNGWRPVKSRYWGWIHIEIHIDDFEDGRPVEEKLGGAPAPSPSIGGSTQGNGPAQGAHPWQRFIDASPKPVLRIGSKGEYVRYIQEVSKAHNVDIAVDGHFGTQTDARVKDMQRFFGLAVDGIVGNKQTWPVYDLLATLKIEG